GFRLLQRRITMLNQSPTLANSGTRRGVTALIALAVVCSVPWTVTAQTPSTPVVHQAKNEVVHTLKVKNKVVHTLKRLSTRHHVAKKAVKSKALTVAVRASAPKAV